MKKTFRAFFKKYTGQGEKIEFLLSGLGESDDMFEACRMSNKALIVTFETIDQELPLDEAEPEGMDELPLDQPEEAPQPSLTINNIYVSGETGEVEGELDEGHLLPPDGDWVDTSAYESEVDAEVAELELDDDGSYGNTEATYTDQPIPERGEGVE